MSVKGADLKEKGAQLKEQAVQSGQEQMGQMLDAATVLARTDTLDNVMSQFMQAVDDTLGKIDDKASELQVKTDRNVVGGKVSRDGGRLTASVEFDDGTTKQVSAVREKGDLRIVGNEE